MDLFSCTVISCRGARIVVIFFNSSLLCVLFELYRFVGFLFLLGSGKGCGLWLWHSLDFSLTFFVFSGETSGGNIEVNTIYYIFSSDLLRFLSELSSELFHIESFDVIIADVFGNNNNNGWRFADNLIKSWKSECNLHVQLAFFRKNMQHNFLIFQFYFRNIVVPLSEAHDDFALKWK